MAKENGERAVLPYGSWKSFIAFIGKLNKTALPPRIDSSVMTGMSGSGKSELRAALRFLGLIDSADSVTPNLKGLVAAHGTEKWSEVLGEVLLNAYGAANNVLGGEMEWLDNGTAQLLREKFTAVSGMGGAALDRAIRFFLAGLDDAGITYSPHFKVRGARTASIKRPSIKKQKRAAKVDTRQVEGAPPPAGTVAVRLPIRGKPDAVITIPTDISEAEWAMIETFVRTYQKLGERRK